MSTDAAVGNNEGFVIRHQHQFVRAYAITRKFLHTHEVGSGTFAAHFPNHNPAAIALLIFESAFSGVEMPAIRGKYAMAEYMPVRRHLNFPHYCAGLLLNKA